MRSGCVVSFVRACLRIHPRKHTCTHTFTHNHTQNKCSMHGMHRGHVQGRERLHCLHTMCTRQVQYSDSRHLRGYMSELSFLHLLARRERAADQLYLQQRVHRFRWDTVRGVHCGDVQGRERLRSLRLMLARQVQYTDSRHLRGYMSGLSFRHVLECRERAADQLYLQ